MTLWSKEMTYFLRKPVGSGWMWSPVMA
jgi:hypothetical protein